MVPDEAVSSRVFVIVRGSGRSSVIAHGGLYRPEATPHVDERTVLSYVGTYNQLAILLMELHATLSCPFDCAKRQETIDQWSGAKFTRTFP
jgi:hypothetical protein